jgi:hypothetical protein
VADWELVPDPEVVVYEALPCTAPQAARIILTPKEDGTLSIDLEGALAGVLALATDDKRPLAGSGLSGAVTTLVAGARTTYTEHSWHGIRNATTDGDLMLDTGRACRPYAVRSNPVPSAKLSTVVTVSPAVASRLNGLETKPSVLQSPRSPVASQRAQLSPSCSTAIRS